MGFFYNFLYSIHREITDFLSYLQNGDKDKKTFFRNCQSGVINNRYTGCPENSALPVHYGVEEITVNVRKMLKTFYWTYLLIWRSLKVTLNRSIIIWK
jgi:hypothetical protein